MLIWRNEFQRADSTSYGVSAEPPPGTIEITRVEERDGNHHIWFAPVPAVPACPEHGLAVR